MKDDVKEVVRSVLTDYIETNHCRKTPERFAVLDAAYSLGGFFRTEDLVEEPGAAQFSCKPRHAIQFASSLRRAASSHTPPLSERHPL